MSPEQVRGQEVDTRSDIFSFGVVLYEMLAGVNPFNKGGHMETAKAVLSDTAPPLTRYTEDIPLLLQHTIKKMLAKEPDQRYQLIHDVRTDLGELIVTSGESEVSAEVPAAAPVQRSYLWPAVAGGLIVLVILALAWFWPFTTAPPGEAIDSVAVLLFENQSGDPGINYLSEGIAGEVTYSLSQLSNLRVMPTSAVVRYKGQEITPQRVASDLKVRAVVTGTVSQQGENLFLRVELVDTQEDRLLWGQQYTRKSTDVLALQEEIAQDISENLRLQLSRAEQEQLRKRYTTHPEAHQDYLQGRFHARSRLPEDLERAVEYFNSAIDKDSRYALAYAGLADAYFAQAIYSGRSVEEFYQREVSAAQKALELDDTLSDAHAIMGGITAMHGWDWAAGEEHLTRALELNPNDVRAYQMRAGVFWRQRRWNEALEDFKNAELLNPDTHKGSIARVHRSRHEFDEAIELQEEVAELRPNSATAHFHLAWTYWYNGMVEEAIAEAEKWAPLPKLSPREPKLPVFFRQVASGNRVEAINTLENWQGLGAYRRGEYYAVLGEKEKALEWLSKAVEERHHGAVGANIGLAWDPLRDDPRFQDLLLRMNLEP
jgi:serine/threonine-protein kinase